MIVPHLVALLFLAPPDGPTTAAVFATQTDTMLQERILRVKDWSQALGVTVLDTTEVMRRLTGQPAPRLVDLDEIKKRVEEARMFESRSADRARAVAARNELLFTYDNAIVPDFDLQLVIGRVLHDSAAAATDIRQTKVAQDAARMAQRRFPDVAMDGTLHPREIAALLYRATVDLKRAPRTDVTIVSTRRGNVMADGLDLGTIETTKTVKLAQGTWLFWMFDGTDKSVPHYVTVGTQPVTIDIDFALEARLSWTPVPTLRCDGSSCNEVLRALAKRIGVTEAVGLSLDDNDVRQPATGTFVRTDDGSVESQPVIAVADLFPPPSYYIKAEAEAAKPDRFSAWSLMPFGGGQYAQGRYVIGGIFTGIGAGLATWHIIASIERGNYMGPDADHRSALRTQKNVSGMALIGVGLVSVGEAIYWGYRHPTYPDNATTPPTEKAPRPQPLPEATTDIDAS